MSADTAEMLPAAGSLSPLSLKDAPSFIEMQFPVGRLSAEAYKERKAGSGQTLTALGSYWKGRKPLIENAQKQVAASVEAEITRLGIAHPRKRVGAG
jgi:Protein of unknown function (DUF1156)